MSEHVFACTMRWTGAERGPVRDYDSYSREYRIEFAGKPPLIGSSAPVFRGDGALHNPEDLLVAALCGCHCLAYLALCARAGVEVVSYEDEASGRMAWDRTRKVMAFAEVRLRPRVMIAASADAEQARALHDRAHAECFIASSVNFPVRHEPTTLVAVL